MRVQLRCYVALANSAICAFIILLNKVNASEYKGNSILEQVLEQVLTLCGAGNMITSCAELSIVKGADG